MCAENPFAKVIAAHLLTMATRRDPPSHFSNKVRLVKSLYEQGLRSDAIRPLFRIIDWMMELPTAWEERFVDELHQWESEKQMPYITSVERLAHEQGIEKGVIRGLLEGIEAVLDLRFGPESAEVCARIRQVTDPSRLEEILRSAKTVARPEELLFLFEN